jgi:methylated-DNA-[protein]-cysteine S-methyltransferase
MKTKEKPHMRCREVEALWDELRADCKATIKRSVEKHLRDCPPCQDLYEEYEGVAYRLSALPQPQPSCDLTKRVIMHIAQISVRARLAPIVLSSIKTPIGKLYVGIKENRIAYIAIANTSGSLANSGSSLEEVSAQVEHRLRRPVIPGKAPEWLRETIDRFFSTWRVDEDHVDLSDLSPFQQAALRAAAKIPPGEVRSYQWVAMQIGRPKAARAVGQVMARNPIPLLFPCHRVVDSAGELHNYGYGLKMKARLLRMEGYQP